MMKIVLHITILFYGSIIIGQCPMNFPSTVPDDDCLGLPELPTSNTVIDDGDVYGFCATSTAEEYFNNINFQGGELWVCGNVTLSSFSLNSGTIVITCGSKLTLSANSVLNNDMKIYNYGTLNVDGDLEFQNNDNLLYNEADSSRLFVSGDLVFPQNNGQDAFLINNGFIEITGDFDARDGGYTCLGDASVLTCSNLNYVNNCGGPPNRFSFSGGDNAIVLYENNADIRSSFTNSNQIEVHQVTGGSVNFNGCGDWGSATFMSSASLISIPSVAQTLCPVSNCFIILPVELIDFSGESVSFKMIELNWQTATERNNDYFLIERSKNGVEWEKLDEIEGAGSSNEIKSYKYIDKNPKNGINYYKLKQFDFNGNFEEFEIISVQSEFDDLLVYPNPTKENLFIKGESLDKENIQIYNYLGVNVVDKVQFTSKNLNEIIMNTQELKNGIYILQINENQTRFFINK